MLILLLHISQLLPLWVCTVPFLHWRDTKLFGLPSYVQKGAFTLLFDTSWPKGRSIQVWHLKSSVMRCCSGYQMLPKGQDTRLWMNCVPCATLEGRWASHQTPAGWDGAARGRTGVFPSRTRSWGSAGSEPQPVMGWGTPVSELALGCIEEEVAAGALEITGDTF